MNKQKNTKYTIKYSLLQGTYWPIYCASVGFASVFLLSKNFSNSQIGIVLAIANIFAVFLQPAIASFADTTTKISLKHLIALLASIEAIITAVLLFVPNIMLLVSILVIAELTLLFTLQPLANAIGMHMINKGIHLNFGLARGIGSFAVAIFSYIIGYFIEQFGSNASTAIALAMLLLFIVFTCTFASNSYFKKEENETSANSTNDALSGKKAEKPLSMIGFALKYKKFVVLLLAVATTFCYHFMLNNYFIQVMEHVGGDTKSMGTALGLAAAVELPAMALFTVIVKKVRCSTILKMSFAFFLVKSILTFLAPNVLMIYVSQLLQFASYAFFIPASIYYVNQTIGENDLVKGQAFMTGAISLGGVLASLLGGVLLDGPGVRTMLIVGVIATIIGLLLCLISIERTPDPKDNKNSH